MVLKLHYKDNRYYKFRHEKRQKQMKERSKIETKRSVNVVSPHDITINLFVILCFSESKLITHIEAIIRISSHRKLQVCQNLQLFTLVFFLFFRKERCFLN